MIFITDCFAQQNIAAMHCFTYIEWMAQTQHRLLDWLHCLSVSAHTQQTQLCAALLAQIAERASMYGGDAVIGGMPHMRGRRLCVLITTLQHTV